MSEVVEVKTIGEVERIVHDSGLWDGTGPVEFSNDGETWTQAWAPSDDHPHPEFARVSVYRKDVRIPTAVTIRWDEQFPEASEDWSGMWTRSPMRHFGRTVRMVGFRQTFRELLQDIVIEDEDEDEDRASAPVPPAARDWEAEILAASTDEELLALVKDARAARVFKPTPEGTALDRLWKSRRAVLAATVPADAPPLSADEKAEHDRFFPEDARPVPHPPTVKLTPVSAAAPAKPRAPRKPTAVSTALAEAAERAQAEGRPVDRTLRRASRKVGKP